MLTKSGPPDMYIACSMILSSPLYKYCSIIIVLSIATGSPFPSMVFIEKYSQSKPVPVYTHTVEARGRVVYQ